jgi:hypothetical protein
VTDQDAVQGGPCDGQMLKACLTLASHFTYLGVCYPGSNASLTLSNPNNPQPVNFTAQRSTPPSAPELSEGD